MCDETLCVRSNTALADSTSSLLYSKLHVSAYNGDILRLLLYTGTEEIIQCFIIFTFIKALEIEPHNHVSERRLLLRIAE